jgi:hypothetical protein
MKLYPKSMVIIITGQSGLDSDAIIENFIAKYPFKHGEKPAHFKVEGIISESYRIDKQLKESINRKTLWKRFLREPYKLQEKYWCDAIKIVSKKISDTQCVFINLHACYFHRKTLEYLSLVNISLLKKLQPCKIITLIDDVYEIHHRLRREPDDVFYPSIAATPTDVLLEYLRVLDWRSKEIMMSRFIANSSGCDNFVFAIKHSWDIFYNLVYDKRPTAYLSHPISEVRRLEWDGKMDAANKIKDEIKSVSEELKEHFAVFLPTTIDEFRIEQEKKSKNEIFYTVLGERWDSKLYTEPRNMLYSYSEFQDINELWTEEKNDFPSQDFNLLLKTLNDSISAQVTTRDYTLVEQSQYLVVYRPLFNGNQSGGVDKESGYHRDLIRTTELLGSEKAKSPKYFVYCPIEDINFYKRNTFNFYIEERIKKGIFFSKTDNFSTISDAEYGKLLDADRNRDDLIAFLKEVNQAHNIHIVNIKEYKSKRPLKDNEEIVDLIYEDVIDDYLINIDSVIKLYSEIVDEFPEHSIFDHRKFVKQIIEKLQ